MTGRFLSRPARHAFGDYVEIRHMAGDVGAYDRVADRVERDLRAFLFLEQHFRSRNTVKHIIECLRQHITVEATLEEIIVRSALYRQLGDFLILRSTEDEDWNLRRCAI